MRWTALGLIFTFPASMFTAVLKGTMRFDRVGMVQIAANLMRAICTVVAIKAGSGLAGLAQASVAANALALFLAFGFVWRMQKVVPWRPLQLAMDELRGIISYGVAALLAHGGWFLAYATDSIVIGIMLTPADIAYFGLPVTILAMVSGVAGNLAANFLPLASQLQAAGENAKLQSSFTLAVRYTLVLAVPAVLTLFFFGPALLAAWLGQDFAAHAAPVFRILACSYLCSISSGPALQSALGLGMQNIVARVSIAEGVSNLILSVVLARSMGLTGVALGTLVPALVVHGIIWPWVLCRKLELSPGEYFRKSILPVVLPLAVAAPLAFMLHALLQRGALAVALFSAIAVPLIYWTGAWFSCFDAAQRTYWKTKLLSGSGAEKATP